MSNEFKISRSSLSEIKCPNAQITQLKAGEPAVSNDDESTPTATPTTTPTMPTATADTEEEK
jgi:hypothetical protein